MSYANFPAESVIKACESYLSARQKRIDNLKESTIENLVGKKTWIWSKPLTREQAANECHEELFYIEITGGQRAGEISDMKALAQMAQKCNTLVTVKAELARSLLNHF